jgi:hypothetical protein
MFPPSRESIGTPLEKQFESSFEALFFEELVRIVERRASALEVRRWGDQQWEARLWVEEFPGTTWPLTLYLAKAGTATAALLAAWKNIPAEFKCERILRPGPYDFNEVRELP